MTERWKAIADCPGYEISDAGRVRSVARIIMRSNGAPQTVCERIIKQTWDTAGDKGHLTVTIYRRRRKVHALVLTAFVGQASVGMEGCHNDGDPANNALTNLRWDTHRNNALDRTRHGRHYLANRKQCIRHHDFDGVYVSPSGRRQRTCSRCHAIRQAHRRKTAAERNAA